MGSRSSNSNTPDFWATATIADGALVQDGGTDCVLTRSAAGVYLATLAYGGADEDTFVCAFSFTAAAGGFVRVVDTSDTVKSITITDSANAALEATKIRFAAWKGA
jgi:hypothetical protein